MNPKGRPQNDGKVEKTVPKWTLKWTWEGGSNMEPKMVRNGRPGLDPQNHQNAVPKGAGMDPRKVGPHTKHCQKMSPGGGPENGLPNEALWGAKAAKNRVPKGTPKRSPKWAQHGFPKGSKGVPPRDPKIIKIHSKTGTFLNQL